MTLPRSNGQGHSPCKGNCIFTKSSPGTLRGRKIQEKTLLFSEASCCNYREISVLALDFLRALNVLSLVPPPHFMQTFCTQNSHWAGITEKDGKRLIPKDYNVSLQSSQLKNRFERARQCHQASELLLNQNLLESCLHQCQFSTREKQHSHSSAIFYAVTF